MKNILFALLFILPISLIGQIDHLYQSVDGNIQRLDTIVQGNYDYLLGVKWSPFTLVTVDTATLPFGSGGGGSSQWTLNVNDIYPTTAAGVVIGATSTPYRFSVQNSDGSLLAQFKDTDSAHDGLIIWGDADQGGISNSGGLTTQEGVFLNNTLDYVRIWAGGSESFRVDGTDGQVSFNRYGSTNLINNTHSYLMSIDTNNGDAYKMSFVALGDSLNTTMFSSYPVDHLLLTSSNGLIALDTTGLFGGGGGGAGDTISIYTANDTLNGVRIVEGLTNNLTFHSSTGDFIVSNDGTNNALHIDGATGNVGINGTGNYDLDVTGQARFTQRIGVGTAPNGSAAGYFLGGDLWVANNGGNPRFLYGDNFGTLGQFGGFQWDSSNDVLRLSGAWATGQIQNMTLTDTEVGINFATGELPTATLSIKDGGIDIYNTNNDVVANNGTSGFASGSNLTFLSSRAVHVASGQAHGIVYDRSGFFEDGIKIVAGPSAGGGTVIPVRVRVKNNGDTDFGYGSVNYNFEVYNADTVSLAANLRDSVYSYVHLYDEASLWSYDTAQQTFAGVKPFNHDWQRFGLFNGTPSSFSFTAGLETRRNNNEEYAHLVTNNTPNENDILSYVSTPVPHLEYVNPNRFTGWAQYRDTTFTTSSRLTLTTGNQITLPNNADVILDSQMPIDIDSMYNRTDTTITGRNGDGLSITIQFKCAPTSATAPRINVSIDIGGTIGEIFQRDFLLSKGNGVTHYYLSSFTGYTAATWAANGGKVKIRSDDAGSEIWDIQYVLTRTHKAR